ncbi:unnamed protein product [Lampetra planeri]
MTKGSGGDTRPLGTAREVTCRSPRPQGPTPAPGRSDGCESHQQRGVGTTNQYRRTGKHGDCNLKRGHCQSPDSFHLNGCTARRPGDDSVAASTLGPDASRE